MTVTGYFDGACEPNPGTMGIGAIVLVDGAKQDCVTRCCGYGTNNEAEWLALIALLGLLIEHGHTEATIYGDSDLVVNQINGKWKVKAANLKPLRARARELLRELPGVTVEWIRRDGNVIADQLSKFAIA